MSVRAMCPRCGYTNLLKRWAGFDPKLLRRYYRKWCTNCGWVSGCFLDQMVGSTGS